MPINILMPALSPTMEKGNLSKWLKKEGDKVKAGDVIAEIETDKATMEVEAVDEGKLARILIPEGTDNVKVNTPIAVLAGDGEAVDAAAKAPVQAAPAGMQEAAESAAPAIVDIATHLGPFFDFHLSGLTGVRRGTLTISDCSMVSWASSVRRESESVGSAQPIAAHATSGAPTQTSRGMRPSFTTAAPPEEGRRWFDRLVALARAAHPGVETGRFGAHMKVHLINDGPVTFRLEVR